MLRHRPLQGETVLDLYYFKSAHGNFGDDLNTWFWDEVLPGWREMAPGRMLVGVGSLLNRDLPRGQPKTVLGSGVAYGALPDMSDPEEWDIQAVRGPLSARALGLPAARGIVDPAVLIADMPGFRDAPARPRPIFIPHHKTLGRHDWGEIFDRAGMDYVSPEGDARDVIRAIAGAPLVVAESMHAAILADAFRVPWTAVQVSHTFNLFKWQDWAASLEIPLHVTPMFPELDWIARHMPRRSAAPAPAPAPAPAAAAPDPAPRPRRAGPPNLRLRARIAVERQFAIRALRRILHGPVQLSDAARLEARKAQLRAVLAAQPARFAASGGDGAP